MASVRSESVYGFAGRRGETAPGGICTALAGGLRRFDERESIQLLACRLPCPDGHRSYERKFIPSLVNSILIIFLFPCEFKKAIKSSLYPL